MSSVNSYDEYGLPGASNLWRFQYTGQIWLEEVALYHYRARVYDPATGRFLQTDPILHAGGMNLYAYVGSDPMNATDPLGLDDNRVEQGVSLSGSWRDGTGLFLPSTIGGGERDCCGGGGGSPDDIIVIGRRTHDEFVLPPWIMWAGPTGSSVVITQGGGIAQGGGAQTRIDLNFAPPFGISSLSLYHAFIVITDLNTGNQSVTEARPGRCADGGQFCTRARTVDFNSTAGQPYGIPYRNVESYYTTQSAERVLTQVGRFQSAFNQQNLPYRLFSSNSNLYGGLAWRDLTGGFPAIPNDIGVPGWPGPTVSNTIGPRVW